MERAWTARKFVLFVLSILVSNCVCPLICNIGSSSWGWVVNLRRIKFMHGETGKLVSVLKVLLERDALKRERNRKHLTKYKLQWFSSYLICLLNQKFVHERTVSERFSLNPYIVWISLSFNLCVEHVTQFPSKHSTPASSVVLSRELTSEPLSPYLLGALSLFLLVAGCLDVFFTRKSSLIKARSNQ